MVMAFVRGDELARKKDIINPNLIGATLFTPVADASLNGDTKGFTLTAGANGYTYVSIPLKTSFKNGQAITISMVGNLSGPNSGDGSFKVSIYSQDTNICYDSQADNVFLKSGVRNSKTIVVNADSNFKNPPCLLIYAGKAGKCNGNTLAVNNIKAEFGDTATQYVPNYEAEINQIKSDIQTLKTKLGG